ncbi:MAG: hypothetical protein JXN65_09640 [Clostridia bacterium]|nr:hypothetical protein [Clostridia bacterium]
MDIKKLIDAVSNYKLENKRNAKFLQLSMKVKDGRDIKKDDLLFTVHGKSEFDFIKFTSEKILFICDFFTNPYNLAYKMRHHSIKYKDLKSFKIINGCIYINEDKALFKTIKKKQVEHYWKFFNLVFNIISPKIQLEHKVVEAGYKAEIIKCRSCGAALPHGLKPDTKCPICGKLWQISKRYVVEDYRMMFTYKNVEKCTVCGSPIKVGADGQKSCTNQFCSKIVYGRFDVNYERKAVPETIVERKRCYACSQEVPIESGKGDQCPHCGIVWLGILAGVTHTDKKCGRCGTFVRSQDAYIGSKCPKCGAVWTREGSFEWR